QALPGGRVSSHVADRERVHLLHGPERQPVRHEGQSAWRQLMEAWRHQRVDPHELPAHHAPHPGVVRQRPESRFQRAFHDPGKTVKEKLAAFTKSQRSQGLTEFAIIAPVILLLTFGIIDFGRALYLYLNLTQSIHDGARVAIRT